MLAAIWLFVKAYKTEFVALAIGLAVSAALIFVRHDGYKDGVAHEAGKVAQANARTDKWRSATGAWTAAVGRQNKALDAWKEERDRKVSDAEKAAHAALRGQKAVEGRVEKLLHAKLSGKDVCERFEEADNLVLGGLR